MNKILTVILFCLAISSVADSFRVGQGQKWHQKSTNNLSVCKLSIDPLAKPSTNTITCRNCIRATK